MNRDDLLKRCVDRRVAHETSVVAVSHLFYVYLLSALKKGQQVEVPNFGTFGTHMVGVKRQRRMPFFAVEEDLADKVNERYRNLKTFLVGKYELLPAEGQVEYSGKEPKYDSLVETAGKEVVLDTDHEVTADGFQRLQMQPPPVVYPVAMGEPTPAEPLRVEPIDTEATKRTESEAEPAIAPPTKEKNLMPKLNLRGEGMEDETQPVGPPPELTSTPPPTLRDISGSEGPSPLLQIALGLLVLGAITFALNHFGIVHFWGKKAPSQQVVEESLPPAIQPPPQTEQEQPPTTESPVEKAEQTPTPIAKEEPTLPKKETPTPAVMPPPVTGEPAMKKEIASTAPAGTGNFTVQVSSWTSRSDAERVASRLGQAGFEPYVAEGFVNGRKWFRVRVGRYATAPAAQAAAAKLRSVNENGVWVTKVQ